jgi:hypothetical protein
MIPQNRDERWIRLPEMLTRKTAAIALEEVVNKKTRGRNW